MKYRVRHETSYEYAEPVSICHNEARLEPRVLVQQRVLDAKLEVSPEPASLHRDADYFGNIVHSFSLEEPHTRLDVISSSVVEVSAAPALEADRSPPWERVAALIAEERSPEALGAFECTFPSPLVALEPAAADYARASFTPRRPLLEAVAELNQRIFEDFTYCPGVTDVLTPVARVFETRSGVCQDFAHLFLSMLRSLGLGARYVSGYLRTRPPPGQPRLIGADASHAWVSVYCPGRGYVDFDPTNGVAPSEEHITVAWGRDYGDVSPLKGVLFGSGEHTVRVGVTVEELI